MAKQSLPNTILNRALDYGVGKGDSLTEVLLGLYKLLEPNQLVTQEEARSPRLSHIIVSAASERILVFGKYSGFARNLSAFLEIIADRITRMPKLIGIEIERLRSCVISLVSSYIQEAIVKTYEYCKNIEGNLLIIPRGTLAYACALGKKNSPLKGNLIIPVGGDEVPPLFNELKPKTVYWHTSYQSIENGEIHHVVSQLEFASHMGFIASLGTTEFSILLQEKYGEARLHLIGHPLVMFPGVMPKIESLPRVRVKTTTVREEEYPVLELSRWNNLGSYMVILNGEKSQLRLPMIRAGVKKITGAMVSRLGEAC